MLHITLCPATLLVLLSIWHGGFTLPITTKEPVTSACVLSAQALLDNITDALTQDNGHPYKKNLFKGFSCSQQSIDLNTETDTPYACAPHGTSCSGVIKSQFNQEVCMENIEKDLHHYYKVLSGHPDPDMFLRGTLLLSLRELMMTCFSPPEDLNKSPSESPSNYDDRLSLCKKLKGFHIRTITINRALGYMHSGEHNK
ncbi:interleukin-12 subunit alpha [Boleophthalmus pectinirostris]|uniref:interleukin-12 subunit alpha n=1 Tax=Boleophthalmus pectinirostris TaxID=150288 RepID=UPI002432A1AD|nr:interleukin-12 subunit alpha [Boleophthalmus pectinirostris]